MELTQKTYKQYGVNNSDINTSLISLNILYESIPETVGCEQCPEKNPNETHWCCKVNSPSMYYVEFLKVWKTYNSWSKVSRQKVLVNCIKNYLSNEYPKGCVFYENGCTVYNDRPLSCRMYGIIPKPTWDKRWEYLKNRDGDKFTGRSQCNLVSTADGTIVTSEFEDKIFKYSQQIELKSGVNPKSVSDHDGPNGSYRTFYDHILLEIFNEDVLQMLTKIKLSNPCNEDIDSFAKTILDLLSNYCMD